MAVRVNIYPLSLVTQAWYGERRKRIARLKMRGALTFKFSIFVSNFAPVPINRWKNVPDVERNETNILSAMKVRFGAEDNN